MTEAYILLASGKKFDLTKESNTVGRVAENDIQIDDQSISRNHATLTFSGDTWTVTDHGSKNKTFISEKPIEPNKPTPLKDGQTLHFGYVAVKFHVKAAAQSGNETMAVDLNNPDIAAMFQEASQKSAPRSAPSMSSSPGGVEEMRSNRKAYAYLELRSVTNPTKYAIEKESVLIGTDAGEVDIRVIDSTASAIHAEIRFLKGKKIQLKNMSQDSGTQLNGRRIGKAFIKEGDQIDIGDSSFTFHFVDWPDVSVSREAGSATAARFIIVLLVLMVAGGGVFALFKMGYLGKKGTVTALSGNTPSNTINATAPDQGIDVSQALDLVTQKNYNQANDMFIRLVKAAPEGQATDLRAMQDDLTKLKLAKERLDARDYIGAYVATKSLDFQNSQVANRATDVQREIQRRFSEAIASAKSDYEKAENAQQWDEALRKVAILKQTAEKTGEEIFDGSTAKLAAAESRIKAKQDLQLVYAASSKNLDMSYEQVINDTNAVLDRTEAKTKDNAELKNDIAKYLTNIESLRAHAQLLKEYFNFDGENVDAARNFRNAIAVDYEKRQDADRRLATMEQIAKIYGEYMTLLNDYKDKKDPNQNPILFYDQVISKLEAILAIEGDSRFELAQTSSQEITRLRDDKKRKLLEAFSVQATGTNFPTGVRGDLERLLAERKRWYEYLQLFSLNVRDNRYKDLVLSDALKDDEVVQRFKEAYDRYDKSRSEVLKVILRNWQESTDLGMKKDSLTYIDRLQSLTLPEDKDTEKAILSTQNQLR